MAIYHFSVKAVSRSSGRSATGAAAYRSAEKIVDERTGEIHDYTRKGGVESADLVLPDGSPAWANDRAKLWNAAEQAERRKDACVAREYEVALPAELSPAERRRLAVDFAKEMANREGCAVDVCIHAPGKEGDQRNHHAHILRTTRKVAAEGLGDKLDTEKAGRNRAADLEAVRARWAELTNERLRENGIEATVDHRSLAAQGIDREPTVHLGPAATGIERRGVESRRGLEMRERIEAGMKLRQERQAKLQQAQADLGQGAGSFKDKLRERQLQNERMRQAQEHQAEAQRRQVEAERHQAEQARQAEAASGLLRRVGEIHAETRKGYGEQRNYDPKSVEYALYWSARKEAGDRDVGEWLKEREKGRPEQAVERLAGRSIEGKGQEYTEALPGRLEKAGVRGMTPDKLRDECRAAKQEDREKEKERAKERGHDRDYGPSMGM